MNRIQPKRPRVKLDPKGYDQLRLRILERDSWRCQNCGRMRRLQIHHKELRSHAGSDSQENLVTLCAECHAKVHSQG